MEDEEWRPIRGYELLYEVSNQGRVRRIGTGGGARIGRILSSLPHRRGYRSVQLWAGGKPHMFLIHRLVAEAFLGSLSDGKLVNHKDGVKTHNVVENLEVTSRGGNMKHAYALGLKRRSNTKLTEAQVIAMRQLNRQGVGWRRLARQFGVSTSTVRRILKKRLWANV